MQLSIVFPVPGKVTCHLRANKIPCAGNGFRAAHEAFQNHGLPKVLEHVRRHGTLPLDAK